jgi:hypothetical protein
VAVATSSGTDDVPTHATSSPWSPNTVAGEVAYVTDRGTFWVYSPFTKGHDGEWRSCSDLCN